jgi:hypothetical protein
MPEPKVAGSLGPVNLHNNVARHHVVVATEDGRRMDTGSDKKPGSEGCGYLLPGPHGDSIIGTPLTPPVEAARQRNAKKIGS